MTDSFLPKKFRPSPVPEGLSPLKPEPFQGFTPSVCACVLGALDRLFLLFHIVSVSGRPPSCQHGQHSALEAIQARLRPDERLMAFLDDIYAKSNPNRSGQCSEELQRVGIQVHDGKTQLWNRSGVVPTGTEALTEAARTSDPDAIGDVSLPLQERGVKVLGTPMGSPFVRSTLAAVSAKHDRLISQIVGMSDLQCAWILLLYCAAARPSYMLRVVHPL